MSRARRTLAAALALGLALPATAGAGAFYIVNRTPQAWTVLDPAAVETLAGGVRRVPSVTVQKSITPRGPARPGYLRSVSEYDCEGRRTRWLRFTLYDASGAVVMSQTNARADWSRPSRGTEGSSALILLCDGPGALDTPVISAPSIGDLILGLFASWS